MYDQQKWWKMALKPGELNRLKRLAAGRGKNMSEYVRWLIDKDALEQEREGPKPEQQSLFSQALW